MTKFTYVESTLIKSIVATLSIKRLSNSEIIKEVFKQTNKTITDRAIAHVRKRIKKESHGWYKIMREGEYEYIHEFKERIDEILWLQRKHYEIIENEKTPVPVKQASLAELHRLNITLSNYFDVAPSIVGNASTLPTTPENNKTTTEAETRNSNNDIIV
jgi:hypothetical protein